MHELERAAQQELEELRRFERRFRSLEEVVDYGSGEEQERAEQLLKLYESTDTRVAEPVRRSTSKSRRLARAPSVPYKLTSSVLRTTLPYAVDSFGRLGVYIGVRIDYGSAFAYDPFIYYQQGIIQNPNMVLFGSVGSGKSSLVKTYCARQWLYGRKLRIFDGKGEYGRMAQLMDVEPIRIYPGGPNRLNPLDSSGHDPWRVRDFRIRVLRNLAETRRNKSLTSLETRVLDAALDDAVSICERAEPVIPNVIDTLLQPDSGDSWAIGRLRLDMSLSDGHYYDLARPIAADLMDLCQGSTAGMFDGQTTRGVDPNDRVVIFDTSQLDQGLDLALFMVVASAYLHNSLVNTRDANIIVVYEEGWHLLNNIGTARAAQRAWKLARLYGMQNLLVVHRPSDLNATGDEGSEIANLTKGLLSDSGTKVIYSQEAQELERTAELLSLSDAQKSLIPLLRTGDGLWVPQGTAPWSRVHHMRGDLEEWITNTDEDMERGADVDWDSLAAEVGD